MDYEFCAFYLAITKSSVICVNNRKGREAKPRREYNHTTN